MYIHIHWCELLAQECDFVTQDSYPDLHSGASRSNDPRVPLHNVLPSPLEKQTSEASSEVFVP